MPFAAVAPAPAVVQMGRVISWETRADPQGAAFRSGPYVLRIRSVHSDEGEGGGEVARLEIEPVDGRAAQAVVLTGAVGFELSTSVRFAVARLDPRSPAVSVIMTSFTGGAHCCEDLQIATPTQTALTGRRGLPGWSVLHPGASDNAPLGFDAADGGAQPYTLQDRDGDGASELVIPDDGFDYLFGCFACTFQPVRIYGLQAGAIVDLSSEPALRFVLQADMAKAAAACRQGESGACPGYLADAARLGLWSAAFRVVEASVPAHPRWEFPDKLCADGRVTTRCAPGQAFRTIPDYYASVRLFLRWRGYPVPAGE